MVAPPPRSPIAAAVVSVRTALGFLMIAAIGSGFVYGWVFGVMAIALALSIGAILSPLLDADWEGMLGEDSDSGDDGDFDPELLALARRIAPKVDELGSNGKPDRDPPKVCEVIDPTTLDLFRRSYRYMGYPMGLGEAAFQLWMGEFTTWVWHDGRWLAILPAPVVEPHQEAIG